jgi:hypothetical protein
MNVAQWVCAKHESTKTLQNYLQNGVDYEIPI